MSIKLRSIYAEGVKSAYLPGIFRCLRGARADASGEKLKADASMFESCPCGAGETYLRCCGPQHLGMRSAESPETLMRARYSAFAKRDAAFLLKSWAPETRPLDLGDLSDREWLGLTIKESGLSGPDAGYVRFAARYREGGRKGVLKERSRFRRENGLWMYVDGQGG